MPWPQCHIRGRRSLILFEDLARAVKVESLLAIKIAWGVSRFSINKWRKLLEVERVNQGTAARWQSNVALVITPQQNQDGLRRAHAREARIKAEATKSAGSGLRHEWTPEAVAWMGVLSDAAIGERLGRHAQTVGRERRRRGIASIGHSGTLPNLQKLDCRRLRELRCSRNLTQSQLGALLGCKAHRVSHLESDLSPRVKVTTLRDLARALECQPDDLRAK